MSFRTVSLVLVPFVVGLGAGVISSLMSADSDTKLRSVEYKGFKIQLVQNSETLSLALAINSRGSIIGYKEVPNKEGTIFRNVYFYCGKSSSKEMPLPKEYTNVEAAGISDNNWVIGRATRPIGVKDGSLRAVVWDPEDENEVLLLPRPEGDSISDAQDISADGTRITGYSTGPERMRPVLWSWDKQQKKWEVTVLPVLQDHNPYLMSAQLIISPDGKTIVGCCTEKFLQDGTVDSALFMWQQNDNKWERKQITAEQMYVKAINNHGQIVGSVAGQHGRFPCVVTLDGKLQMLQLLPGDESGEARDINNKSEIVGWSDDPHGKEGGTVSCRWTLDGTATPIELCEDGYSSVYGINDDGQLAGMMDLIFPGEDDKPENAKAVALAFRTFK